MFERFLNKISTPTVIRVLVSRGGKLSLCKGLVRRLFLREIPCVRYNNYKALPGSFRREADGKERRAITFLSRRAGTGKVFSRSLPDEEEVGRATVRIVSRKPRLLAKLRGYRYHREAVSAAEYHQDIPQPMRQRVLRHHAITICREVCVGRRCGPLRRYFTQSLRLWVIRMAQKFGPHIVQYSPSFLDPSL